MYTDKYKDQLDQCNWTNLSYWTIPSIFPFLKLPNKYWPYSFRMLYFHKPSKVAVTSISSLPHSAYLLSSVCPLCRSTHIMALFQATGAWLLTICDSGNLDMLNGMSHFAIAAKDLVFWQHKALIGLDYYAFEFTTALAFNWLFSRGITDWTGL